jgi:hypothetical protein
LTEKLKRLLPLEKLHEAAKQRARVKTELPEAFAPSLLRLRPDMANVVHAGM